MRKQFLLPIILLLIIFNSNVYSQNLVLNSSFEDFTSDPRSGAITSINNWSLGGKNKLKANLSTPYDGNSAMYFQDRAKGSVNQILALNANQTFDISIKVKWSAGAIGQGVLNVKDSTGSLLGTLYLDGMELDWTEYKLEFTTTSNSNIEISINRFNTNGVKPKGELHFDDVILSNTSIILTDPSMIYNDTWWEDNNGDNVLASMGGHVTKVGDTYYWVGNDPQNDVNGFDIRLYSSKTLGSNSWKFEALIDDRPIGLGRTNCTLLHNPNTNRYVIINKGINFYQSVSDDIRGPYEYIRKVNVNNKFGHPEYESGGMSAYSEGNDAYIIVSNKLIGGRDRFCGIWKLSSDFLNIEEEILWTPSEWNREAYWLFKKDNMYYMTYDGPGGWAPSDSYYRTSTSLGGTWSEEKEIGMDPVPTTRLERSHGSQSRWMINVDGQWIYGGDRYPYQEVESHPFEKGLYLWCPVVWEGEKPIVKFEKTWSIAEYKNLAPSQSKNALLEKDILYNTVDTKNLLLKNYPNPFTNRTSINYSVPSTINSTDIVTLKIFNLRGQLVKELINKFEAPGNYTIEWDGTGKNNNKVSSSIYFAQITVAGQKNTIKLLYSKK